MQGSSEDSSFEQLYVNNTPVAISPFSDAKLRAVEDFEIGYLKRVLEVCGGNVSEAGRRAGLDRSNFKRLLRRYGISPRKE